MSVIVESLPGDEFVCIEAFVGCPQGERFSWDNARHFTVGERLNFVSSYLDDHFKAHPCGWMIVFDAADGKRYAATQSYFVLPECWEGLRKHFARRRRKVQPPKKAKNFRMQSPKKAQPVAAVSKKRRIA